MFVLHIKNNQCFNYIIIIVFNGILLACLHGNFNISDPLEKIASVIAQCHNSNTLSTVQMKKVTCVMLQKTSFKSQTKLFWLKSCCQNHFCKNPLMCGHVVYMHKCTRPSRLSSRKHDIMTSACLANLGHTTGYQRLGLHSKTSVSIF